MVNGLVKIKKSMTVFDVIAWVNECRDLLRGSRVNNIYYTGSYWAIKIPVRNGKKYIKIEPGKRVHLSIYELYSKSIDKLTAFLRKHIRGGIIEDISHPGFERIVFIDVDRGGRRYRIVAELLPRGFLVITHNDVILYANKFSELRDRVIRPREKYRLPPASINPLDTDLGDLIELVHRGKDLVRGLIYGWNLPGEVAEEILYRASLYDVKTIKPDTIDRRDLETLHEVLMELYKEIFKGRGYLIKYGGSYIGFTPYYPRLYSDLHSMEIVEVPSFNDAIDTYFSILEKEEIRRAEGESIRAEINRVKKSIEEQESIAAKYQDLSRMYSEYATLLATNYEYFSEVMECVNRIRKKLGWDGIREYCSGVVDYDPSRGVIVVVLGGRRIELSIRKSLDECIKDYYRLAGEYRAKAEKAQRSAMDLRRRLKEIERETIVVSRRVETGIKPRLWYERFHWLVTSEGFLVIGGRDAGQNEAIVRKYLEPRDIFLHADIHGAPATVLKTRGKVPGERSLYEASVLAACYSKAWRAGFGEIDVYWVWGEQVSKKPPSGEYLGKGAFMIYGRKNYIRHVRLELAIGVEEVYDEIYGRYQRVVVGPRELVNNRSLAYVVLVPGKHDPSRIAKKIYDLIKNIVKGELLVKVEEIIERLPGSSNIVYVGKSSRSV